MFQYSFTSLKINETFLFASGIFHAECHNYSFLKKLSQFSFTALSQLKVTVTFPFITEEKIQTHCRVLSGGPIPLKGVAAELHCSCRLYFLVAQGLEETWGAWQGTGRLCSSLPGTTRQKSALSPQKQFVMPIPPAAADGELTLQRLRSGRRWAKNCIKPMSLSYTWVEKLHSKKHWYQLEIICTGENDPFSNLFPLREVKLQDAASQNIYYVFRNRQVHNLGGGNGSCESFLSSL